MEKSPHFPGLKGLDMPIVWVFPKLEVCLECGFAEFEIPETELHVLANGAPPKLAGVIPCCVSSGCGFAKFSIPETELWLLCPKIPNAARLNLRSSLQPERLRPGFRMR
jgi:hypothetical protein